MGKWLVESFCCRILKFPEISCVGHVTDAVSGNDCPGAYLASFH